MDYLCGKFGNYSSFSRFGFIVHTHTYIHTDVDERNIPATLVGVSNKVNHY